MRKPPKSPKARVRQSNQSKQKQPPQRPDPNKIGIVAYLQFLAENKAFVDTREKSLTERELLTPLLLRLYEEDRVAGRAILGDAAKLLRLQVDEMQKEFDRLLRPAADGEPASNGAANPSREAIPYAETEFGIVWRRPTKDGEISVRLTNFTARIVSDLVEDDGVEVKRCFEIEAQQGGRTATLKVLAERYAAMGWTAEALGAKAILSAGQSIKDHAREAIQWLSGDVAERRVYTHLGWRKIGDTWYYLHAGGAIGEDGKVPDVEVAVPPGLDCYLLPEPPQGQALQDAIRASLRVLQVAPDRITFPNYSALWRAVLGETDFSLHLVGHTGAGKTELAALTQQHHGAMLDARHLPASWSSTGNSLEGTAFTAKDCILTVDDFAPSGSIHDIQRYHREADRILRAQGNRLGRQRMRADTTLRAAKPPRGLILSTGEDVPKGQSIRARLMIGEVSPGDIDWQRMTLCQQDAAAGLYAQALAGFVCWAAGHYETLIVKLREEVARLRAIIQAEHKRTPDIIANLAAGFQVFLDFATESGAVLQSEREALWQQAWSAFIEAATLQARYQGDSDPAQRFVELLVAALVSGQAHLDGLDGEIPPEPHLWGWDSETTGDWQFAQREYRAKGRLVGWVGENELYLEPEASFAVVQRLAQDQGEAFPVSQQTLRKRLKESGYLATWDDERQRTTVRRILGGCERTVLHIVKNVFTRDSVSSEKKPAKPSSGQEPPEDQDNTTEKPSSGQQNRSVGEANRPEKTQEESGIYSSTGRNGRVSTGAKGLDRSNKPEGTDEAKPAGQTGRFAQEGNRPVENRTGPESSKGPRWENEL